MDTNVDTDREEQGHACRQPQLHMTRRKWFKYQVYTQQNRTHSYVFKSGVFSGFSASFKGKQ